MAKKKNSETPNDQKRLHVQLAGPHVINAIDRSIRRLETLVEEAGSADREKLDQIKVQIQGTNYLVSAQMKKLDKVIPNATRAETPAAEQASLGDRMWAAAWELPLAEFLQRKAEDTLPPRPPLPIEEGYKEYEAACGRGDDTEAAKYVKPHAEHRELPEEELYGH